MGLKYYPEALMGIILCRLQSSTDLLWMMGIIINHRYSADLSLFLKPPVCSRKFSEACNYAVKAYT